MQHFGYRFDPPKVKRDLIFNIIAFVYELPHELPNNLRWNLRKQRDIRKMSKLARDSAHSSFQI